MNSSDLFLLDPSLALNSSDRGPEIILLSNNHSFDYLLCHTFEGLDPFADEGKNWFKKYSGY